MADRKISELTNITGVDLADGDELVVVDASASETKAITFGEFKNALDTATGFVSITGDTMTGDLSFGDNDKAIFGVGSDLQIYTDGTSNDYIDSTTAHVLQIRGSDVRLGKYTGETFVRGAADGAVTLYYDNAIKLATTSTGIDVTGTVTADGLTVDGSGTVNITSSSVDTLQLTRTDVGGGTRILMENGNDNIWRIQNDGANVFSLAYNTSTAFGISNNGDISFYEDTGTTAKFFWDASAESLGIGTSSPDELLDLETSGTSRIRMASNVGGGTEYRATVGVDSDGFKIQTRDGSFGNLTDRVTVDVNGNVGIGTSSPSDILHIESSTVSTGLRLHNTNTGGGQFRLLATSNTASIGGGNLAIYDQDNAAYRFVLDSSGNVGIGTTSPTQKFHCYDATGNILGFFESGDAGAYLRFADNGTTNNMYLGAVSNDMLFATNGSERMRIDSSGNLLVGTTDSTPSTNTTGSGIALSSTGTVEVARDGNHAIRLNRMTSDGDIAVFRKDGTTVGSIGSRAGVVSTLILDPRTSSGTGVGITGANQNTIMPTDAGGNLEDAAIDLGDGFTRFRNLYLSGGVYLGGTGAANKLEDYEEGTWTPVVAGTTTAGTGTYTTQTGAYTKVGDLVYVTLYLGWSAHTGTGGIRITGLPFTVSNAESSRGIGSVEPAGLSYTPGANLTARAGVNSTYINLNQNLSTGTTAIVGMDANVSFLFINVCYKSA